MAVGLSSATLTLDHMLPDDWEDVDEFLRVAYGERYAMRDHRLFTWQFGSPWATITPSVYLLRDDRRVVGMLGYMPVRFRWHGRLIPATWTANWMVLPEHRSGWGVPLLRRLTEEFPVVLGQGAGANTVRIAPQMGFVVFPSLRRYLAIFDRAGTARFAHPALVGTRELVEELARFGAVPELTGSHIRRVTSFEKGSYEPDHDLYSRTRIGTLRDAAYLDWRYVRHPLFRYECYVAGGPPDPALLVIRVEEVRGSLGRVVRILELIFPDGSHGIAKAYQLLALVGRIARERGAAFADFVCSADLSDVLAPMGFHTTARPVLALRFQPVDFIRTEENLIAWMAPSLSQAIPPIEDWYVTKADGDQDRPA